MRGVILAGGTGSRLWPLTKITNKHLLPVYDKPMIHYPIEMFVKAGINDIMIVTGGEHIEDFFRLLGDGSEFGARFQYTIQARPDGIAGALKLAEGFINTDEYFAVCLGDNIFQDDDKNNKNDIGGYLYQATILSEWEDNYCKPGIACVFVKEVEHPEHYGVLTKTGNHIHIIEKPRDGVGNLAVTGLYVYPNNVFQYIKTLTPSQRNELEITDINNMYASRNHLEYVEVQGWWLDAGESIDALFKASDKIRSERQINE